MSTNPFHGWQVPDWAEKFHRRYRPTNRSYNERYLCFKVALAVVNHL